MQIAKKKHNQKKTIVFQPYGSSATPHESGIFDDSHRSMPKNMIDYFLENLSGKYNLIFMGAKRVPRYKNL